MKSYSYSKSDSYSLAILIKDAAVNLERIEHFYLTPAGIDKDTVIIYGLEYTPANKAPVKVINNYLEALMPKLREQKVETLLVCDSHYYKKIAGKSKPTSEIGYVNPCAVKDYEDINTLACVNYQGIFHNPSIQNSIDLAVDTLKKYLANSYVELGSSIIHSAVYPDTIEQIKYQLELLHEYPEIYVDIETFSLKFYEGGIGTIAFSWDKHNGIAFPVDYLELPFNPDVPIFGAQEDNRGVKKLLQSFFNSYKGKCIYHGGSFDIKVLVYELYMKNALDTEGMIEGIKILCNKIDDTRLIAFLALNTTAELKLGLKVLAHKFAGNYAEEDINDIRRIPLKDLLEYNVVDCLSTAYVKETYYQKMIDDEQMSPYKSVILPSVPLLVHTELCGMPLDMDRVKEVDSILQAKELKLRGIIKHSNIGIATTKEIRERACTKKNAALKKKRVTVEDFKHVHFNPGSSKQLIVALHDLLGLPILAKTKGKQPATDAKTLAMLVNHTTNPDTKAFIQAVLELTKVSKILSTFIKAFYENSHQKEDGWWYLHGNFNIGGTVSGRLSSSGPNLQTIPSGSTYGKLIKSCFAAPPGWLFAGADFASLEDRISALTTKDPNKLKVYTDGYDGHSLRAFSYFGDQMPNIVNTVESINSISKNYPELRQDSKAPTFLLTYGGTHIGMMKQLGWTKLKSKSVESNYHNMYQVSDNWVALKLEQATCDGYVTVAFGLRVRTPILAKTILGNAATPYEAAAEGRTAGNALGQSYGLLNNRAGIELQRRLFKSDYGNNIRPVAHIHDAQYFMIKDSLNTVHWLNENLGECMAWQELPEIKHDDVKLFGELDIFYPNWAYDITLPNGANKQEILQLCKKYSG